jgi:hypothetical protein
MDRPDIKNPYTTPGFYPTSEMYRFASARHDAFNEGVGAAANYYEGIMAERIETAVNNALNRFLEKYDKEIIPQKIKEAEGEIFAELEDQLTPAYPDPATDQIHYYTLDKDDLLKMKKDRGI